MAAGGVGERRQRLLLHDQGGLCLLGDNATADAVWLHGGNNSGGSVKGGLHLSVSSGGDIGGRPDPGLFAPRSTFPAAPQLAAARKLPGANVGGEATNVYATILDTKSYG